MIFSWRVAIVFLFWVMPSATILAAPNGDTYHLLKKIPLGAAPGGNESFDYVTLDATARRVYLSHGTEVKVIDADSGAVVGTISGTKKNHGIAVVQELGKGFITDGEAGKVVVFSLGSLKITHAIETKRGLDAIIYDPASKHIFAFNGMNKDMAVIDAAKETVIKTIRLPGTPEFAVTDGKGMVYDNDEDASEVVAIDSGTLATRARWSTAPAGAPTALEIDSEHRRLFSAGRKPQMLVMMNADNGQVIQSLPISAGVDCVVYDPGTHLLFVATQEGKLHIFHEDSPDKLSEVDTVITEYGAKTMAFDPKTHNLYLTTADFDTAAAPTSEHPNPRRLPIPGTFRLLIYARSDQ
jgi:hypothetical protein